MSKISVQDVIKLARMSHIHVTEEEANKYAKELEAILAYFEELNEIDTSGVEPTAQVTGLKNVLRADKVKNYEVDRQAMLKNAPDQEDGYVKVKRVL